MAKLPFICARRTSRRADELKACVKQYNQLRRRLHLAEQQVRLLDFQLDSLLVRAARPVIKSQKTVLYVRVFTLEGVRHAYYKYHQKTSRAMTRIQNRVRILEGRPEMVEAEDSDDESDDDYFTDRD